MLTSLVHNESIIWVCVGDLNSLLSPLKKQGDHRFLPSSSLGLTAFVKAIGAVDLGFVGPPFI